MNETSLIFYGDKSLKNASLNQSNTLCFGSSVPVKALPSICVWCRRRTATYKSQVNVYCQLNYCFRRVSNWCEFVRLKIFSIRHVNSKKWWHFNYTNLNRTMGNMIQKQWRNSRRLYLYNSLYASGPYVSKSDTTSSTYAHIALKCLHSCTRCAVPWRHVIQLSTTSLVCESRGRRV